MITGHDIIITSNGIPICYDDLGKGAIPIIFIHGFPFSKSMWQPQMDYFKQTHRVIAMDIRGFGQSMSNDTKENIDLFAFDLICFMDSLEIPKAVVCGLSMGGYIVLNAAKNYQDRLEAVILCATQCVADSEEAVERRKASIADIRTNGLVDYISRTIESLFCAKTLDSNRELVEKVRHIMFSTPTASIIAGLNSLADRADMCDTLNQITIPTLILCGDGDVVTPLAQSEFMQKQIKNSTMQSIGNAGHLLNLEQANTFNQLLEKFLITLK
jgi:3-oxoadipate enol-lactonase